MRKKLFMLLALVMTVMTASAYDLTVGTNEHGTITFTVNGSVVTSADEGQKVTVTITPAEGWVVDEPTGQWFAAVAKARAHSARAASIDLLDGIELTAVAGQQNQWTFTMERADAEISCTYKKLLTNTDITIDDIADQTYNQQALEPEVTVKDAGSVMTLNKDYSIAYYDNINAGTATVTLTGMGSYSGTVSKTFTIAPASVDWLRITLDQTEFVYDGTAKTLEANVMDDKAVLVENVDYTLDYQDNTNAGTAWMILTGRGNYTGITSVSFVINPAELTSMTLAQTSFDYNLFEPVAQTAGVAEVKAGKLTVPAEGYTVEGNTQTEPGEYTVTVKGTGNYSGTLTAQFVINDQVIGADAEETESGEELDDVKLTLSVVDRSNKTLAIDKFTGGASAGTEDITVVVPAEINGWQVAVISQGAMEGLNNVTDIYMPDTKAALTVEQNALPAAANIHTPLALLDDYALMASLKANYETDKVMTAVKPVNKYWTLSSGVDIMLPEGVKAYIAKADGKDGVNILELPATEQSVETERTVVKANNGVLVACPDDAVANVFELVAKASSERPSGMTPSTANDKSYEGNQLCPVIVEEHFEPNSWYILSNNEFHELEPTDNTMVPACKAILPRTSASQARRLTVRNDGNGDTTGIRLAEEVYGDGSDSRWYDLQGNRIDRPAKKGVYIMNGKKVVIKE